MNDRAQLRRMNIGNGNGFHAFALRGGAMAEPIDPFLGVDHAWTSEATFATHPHAGFSALSYLFLDSETGINKRDSLGSRNRIQPGGLHWTAAGRGVVHDEVPAEPGKSVHMLQIFVNLALVRQGAEPFALSLEPQEVPVVQVPGAQVRVPLGRFGDVRSPLRPPTEVSLLDISLDDGAELLVPVAPGHSAFILPVFPAQAAARAITLAATQGSAKVVLFCGRPLRQPVHWQGPLALASAEALTARMAAYQRGEFGSIEG